MHTFMLALRNMQQNRRRSITTLLAMIVGVCAILLFGGFSKDITLGLKPISCGAAVTYKSSGTAIFSTAAAIRSPMGFRTMRG